MKNKLHLAAIAMMGYCFPLFGQGQFSIATSFINPCDHDGSISFSVSGGTAPFNYSLYGYNGHGETGSLNGTSYTFDSLGPGGYILDIYDANNGFQQDSITLAFPFSFTVSNIIGADCPLSNGGATVLVSGGLMPYSYLWSDGETTPTSTNLPAGDNDVTVTDANLCIVAYSELNYWGGAVNIPNNNPYTLVTNSTAEICNRDGSAFATVSNSTGPFTYQWSTIPVQTTAVASSLSAGSYTVTITDMGGCSVSDYVYVSRNSVLQVAGTSTNEQCNHQNGSASASVSGGYTPYTYSWSNGASSSFINNLSANNYTVTVTDNHNCTMSRTFYLYSTSPVQLNMTPVNAICGVSLGSINTAATGGSAPYTYSWSSGATVANITGLTGNNYYSVTVTDNTGCSVAGSRYIQLTSNINAHASAVNSSCLVNNGSVSLSPTSGSPPYSYQWNTGATTSAITNLAPGYYYYTVTDNAGCKASGYSSVSSPTFTLTVATTNETCGLYNGSATANASGGTGTYTYSWSNGATTRINNNLQGDKYYYVTVTDNSGCSASRYSYVSRTGVFYAVVNHTDETPYCSSNNGTATPNISGGVSPFTYHWSNGQTSVTATGLHAGNHTVTITDNNGCSVSKTVAITQPDLLVSVVTANATCYFDSNGSATTLITGGTPPYTYQWGNGQTTAIATGLSPQWPAGAIVTDAGGCSGHSYQHVGYDNLNCAVLIEGNIFDDTNGDCANNSGEGVFENKFMYCSPEGGYTLTNTSGKYSFIVQPGTFTVEQPPFSYWTQNCPATSLVLSLPIVGVVASNDFYNKPDSYDDLRVSIGANTRAVRGLSYRMSLTYFNDGIHIMNGTVTFTYDASLTLTGSVPVATSYSAATQTATYDFTSLAPGTSATIAIDLGYVPINMVVGTPLTFTASVAPIANDIRPFNNSETLSTTVVSSYDPNMMEVEPIGTGLPGYIAREDSILKYTVHFQNTGTYEALEVAIVDTIDSHLNVTSIQQGAASHDCRMQFVRNNILRFIFSDIHLPDSTTNREGSKGFVTFYIQQKPNLVNGAEIKNKAAIYFDYNLPVVTNRVLNTILDTTSCAVPSAAFTFTTNNLDVSFINQGGGFTSSLWDFGDGSSSTGTNPAHTYTSDGAYSVSLVLNNACGADTSAQTISACSPLSFTFIIKGGGQNDEVSFVPHVSEGTAATYHWDFGDGVTSDEPSPTHHYADHSSYTSCLTVSNLCEQEETLCAPVVFTSVNALGNEVTLKIYPNPTSGKTNLLFPIGIPENITVSLYSVLGKEIAKKYFIASTAEGTLELDLSTLPSGIYSVIIMNNRNDALKKVKVVKI